MAEADRKHYAEKMKQRSRERRQQFKGANKQLGVIETKEQKLEHDLSKITEQYDKIKSRLSSNPNALDPERATLDKLARLRKQAQQRLNQKGDERVVERRSAEGQHVSFASSTKRSGIRDPQHVSFVERSRKSPQEVLGKFDDLAELTVANIPRRPDDGAAQAYDSLRPPQSQSSDPRSKSPASRRSQSRKSSTTKTKYMHHKPLPKINVKMQKQAEEAAQILIIDQQFQDTEQSAAQSSAHPN